MLFLRQKDHPISLNLLLLFGLFAAFRPSDHLHLQLFLLYFSFYLEVNPPFRNLNERAIVPNRTLIFSKLEKALESDNLVRSQLCKPNQSWKGYRDSVVKLFPNLGSCIPQSRQNVTVTFHPSLHLKDQSKQNHLLFYKK